MLNLIGSALLAFVMLLSSPAVAHPSSVPGRIGPAQQQPSEEREFVVSGVLRLNSDGVTIKLVHSFRRGVSADAVRGWFTREVNAQYPGYALMTTLVSEVLGRETKISCGVEI